MNSPRSATPSIATANETLFGAGVNTRVGNATFGAHARAISIATTASIRRASRPASAIRSACRRASSIPNLTRYSATFTGTQKFSDYMTLAYGVDWLREEGTSDGSLDFGGGFVLPTSFELTRTTWAPFAEVRLETKFGLSTQLGVRVDDPDGASSVTSPRVRVAYEFAGESGFTVAAAWGKAFKLPSFYALGHPLVGNPDLVPERGESYELELSQEILDGAGRLSATWFDGEFRNAIDFDPGPPPMLVNRNRVDTEGFELAGRVALERAVAARRERDAGEEPHRLDRRRAAQPAGVARRRRRALDAVRGAASFRPRPPTSVRRSIRRSPTGDVRLPSYTLRRCERGVAGVAATSRRTSPSTISPTRSTRSSSATKCAESCRARACGFRSERLANDFPVREQQRQQQPQRDDGVDHVDPHAELQ